MQKPSEQELHIQLTREDNSKILQALAEQPFKKVFELIGKLNCQAQNFYLPEDLAKDHVLFNFTAAEFSLIIKALGELPYNHVCSLLSNLHEQLLEQKKLDLGKNNASI